MTKSEPQRNVYGLVHCRQRDDLVDGNVGVRDRAIEAKVRASRRPRRAAVVGGANRADLASAPPDRFVGCSWANITIRVHPDRCRRWCGYRQRRGGSYGGRPNSTDWPRCRRGSRRRWCSSCWGHGTHCCSGRRCRRCSRRRDNQRRRACCGRGRSWLGVWDRIALCSRTGFDWRRRTRRHHQDHAKTGHEKATHTCKTQQTCVLVLECETSWGPSRLDTYRAVGERSPFSVFRWCLHR